MNNILKCIDEKKQAMLDFTERLVNIDSAFDNPAGIAECSKIVGEKLESLGFQVKYYDIPGECSHVLAQKKGTGNKSVMILGHLDTVFLKGTVATRPFTIKNDRAYGPGVADMKSGVAMALYVLESMYEQKWNDKDVTLFFCGDEEIGHPRTDAAAIMEREGQGKTAAFCLEPGRPKGEVVTGRKGVIIPEMKIKGKAAHAGVNPEDGVSAVLEMAYKTIDLHKLTNIEQGTYCNVGVVNGGTGSAVVPDDAYARMSIRFNTVAEGEKLLSSLRAIAAHNYVENTKTTLLEDRIMYMPLITNDKIVELYELVRKQGQRLGLDVGQKFQGGGSDACWPANAGTPTICGMGPVGGCLHNDQEYMEIDGLMQRAKLLALCIDAI